MNRFNARIAALPGVAYFDLRPLVAAMPASFWHDEIHFTAPGWDRVARRWMEELDTRVGRTPQVGAAALRGVRMPALAGTPDAPKKKTSARKAPAKRARTGRRQR